MYNRRGHRLLAAVALLSAASLAATACGSGSASSTHHQQSGGNTLTVLYDQVGSGPGPFYEAVAKKFHAVTGATVKFQPFTTPSQELTDIETAAVSHSGPDIMTTGGTLVPSAQATKDLRTLTTADWATIGGKSQFFPEYLTLSGRTSNSTVAVPALGDPYVMAYNTKLFSKAGIEHPPTTWTEYVTDAEKINDPSKGIYGTAMDPADAADPWKVYWSIDEQMGSSFISKNGKTAQLDTDDMVKAVEFYFDWITKFHIVDPDSLTWTNPNLESAFASGKVGEVLLQQNGDVPTYEKAAIGHAFAFAPAPVVPYGMTQRPPGAPAAASIVNEQASEIPTYAPLKLSLAYLRVLSSKSMQELNYKLTGNIPVTKSAATAIEKSNPELLSPQLKAIPDMKPTAFVGAWGTLESALAAATTKFATKVAAGGSLPPSYIASVLKLANSNVQAQL